MGATPALQPGSGTIPDANHFTAVAPLADPDSPMVSRLKERAPVKAASSDFKSLGPANSELYAKLF